MTIASSRLRPFFGPKELLQCPVSVIRIGWSYNARYHADGVAVGIGL
jgi:hypothetical protein